MQPQQQPQQSSQATHNSVDILAFCEALWQPGDVREIRTFPSAFVRYPQKSSGYFDSPAAVVRAIAPLDPGQFESIYITLNPCIPDLLARANNRLKPKPKETTSDKDVLRSTYLLIDVDPIRSAGISATAEEKEAARLVFRKVVHEIGTPMIIQDSGNGWHAIYNTDNDANPEAKSAFLQALSAKFSTDKAKIDIAVFNPSRITKLSGTYARKGDETATRQHRIARLLEVNKDAPILHIPTTVQAVQAVHSAQTTATSTAVDVAQAPAGYSPKQIASLGKVRALCSEQGIEVIKEALWKDAAMLKLANCVFDASHAQNEASFVIGAKGKIGYQCFHDSCQDKHWRDVQNLYAPKSVIVKQAKEKDGQASLEDWRNMFAEKSWNFATDELTKDLLVNRERISDAKKALLRIEARDWLSQNGIKRDMAAFDDAIQMFCAKKQINVIKEYLEKTKWDGLDRISELVSFFNTPPEHEFARTLEIWFANAVRRVYEHVGGMVLVLTGIEDTGKSSFAHWMCPLDPDQFFLAADIRPDDKDCRMHLANTLVWEIPEMDKTTRKQDVAGVKAFITQMTFRERKPYGHTDEEFKPIASFIGTVNGSTFLVDQTGNRRFFVVEVNGINWDYEQIDKAQLWAQAVEVYRLKKYETTIAEKEAQRTRNKQFTSKFNFELYLDEALVPREKSCVPVTEIIDFLAERKINFSRNNELWAYLKGRGLERKRQETTDGWTVLVVGAYLFRPIAPIVRQDQYQNQSCTKNDTEPR